MTDARPLFSVVIPTFNRASKVARAVESVLVQTMPDFDIWVIDDGSTDHTNQMLAPYLDRIHYLYQANRGVAGARNQGILQSSGAYIALLDSDDRWRPNKLESIATAVRVHSDSGLFYSQCEVVTATGERLWVDRSRSTHGNACLQLLMGDFLAASTAVIKRESLNQVGLFDSSVQRCEDWDLWLRILPSHELIGTSQCLVRYRLHSQTLSTNPTGMQTANNLTRQGARKMADTDPAWPVPKEQWLKIGNAWAMPWAPIREYLANRQWTGRGPNRPATE